MITSVPPSRKGGGQAHVKPSVGLSGGRIGHGFYPALAQGSGMDGFWASKGFVHAPPHQLTTGFPWPFDLPFPRSSSPSIFCNRSRSVFNSSTVSLSNSRCGACKSGFVNSGITTSCCSRQPKRLAILRRHTTGFRRVVMVTLSWPLPVDCTRS